MAASIPFIRLMVKDISTRGDSRGQAYDNKVSYKLADRPSAQDRLGTKTEIKAHNRVFGTSHIKGDDQSERSILGDANDNGRIMQTHEVTIAYSESGDDASNDDRHRTISLE
jgi:hypothetical protein